MITFDEIKHKIKNNKFNGKKIKIGIINENGKQIKLDNVEFVKKGKIFVNYRNDFVEIPSERIKAFKTETAAIFLDLPSKLEYKELIKNLFDNLTLGKCPQCHSDLKRADISVHQYYNNEKCYSCDKCNHIIGFSNWEARS